ncbi:MAG: hypothetical protein NDI84_00910 [Steroidobacteraceae bacterium]|nr:hypothetical protein [Steroidobacteraceae bacterium]
MRQTRTPRTAQETGPVARGSSWIPLSSSNRVGIDPARWTTRVRQVALWRAMDGWYRRQPTH